MVAEGGTLDALGQAVRSADLSSDAILYLFLPILLFRAGLMIDVRRMLDDIAPILVLAIVAVVVCTFVVGFALAEASGESLVLCLLLGAVIATTDPVAVMGIFRNVGAPRRLLILVEGESLFNDAAAIALYALLLAALIRDAPLDAAEGTLIFLVTFAGGGVLGFIAAQSLTPLMRPLRNQPTAEISMTVALAYSVFIVGQAIGVSGVVGVVVASLVIGATGRTQIPPRTWDGMLVVWSQLDYWASTLVFILAATLVPRFVEDATWADLWLLAVVVIAAHVARALVLYLILPMLSGLGLAQRVGSAYKSVILWGGLRGAFTLALALAITEDPRLESDEQRFVALLSTGFVLFTLFVNAPTLRPLLRAVGLHRLPALEVALRDRAVALTVDRIAERLATIADGYRLPETVRDEVIAEYRARAATLGADKPGDMPLEGTEQLRLALMALSTREEELYLRRFTEQTISRRIIFSLTAKAGRLRDGARVAGALGYRRAASDSWRFRMRFVLARRLHSATGIEGPLAGLLADRFESLLVSRQVIEDLRDFASEKIGLIADGEALSLVDRLLAERLAGCDEALDVLRLQYPDYESLLSERFLRRAALRLEEGEYRALHEESVIGPEVFGDLDAQVAAGVDRLSVRPPLDLGLTPGELVSRVPMFVSLGPDERLELESLLTARLGIPGERLVTKGERGDAMFFIASGAVEVLLQAGSVRLGRGDVVGEIAALTGARRSATVACLTYTQLLVLQGREFRRFVRNRPALREALREIAAVRQSRDPDR